MNEDQDMPEEWRVRLTAIGSEFLDGMPDGYGFALFFFVKPTATKAGSIQYVSSEPRPVILSMLRHFIEKNLPDTVVQPEKERGVTHD